MAGLLARLFLESPKDLRVVLACEGRVVFPLPVIYASAPAPYLGRVVSGDAPR